MKVMCRLGKCRPTLASIIYALHMVHTKRSHTHAYKRMNCIDLANADLLYFSMYIPTGFKWYHKMHYLQLKLGKQLSV